jgi:hypothetical protein
MVTVPLFLALSFTLNFWVVFLALWWLKPVFERLILSIYAQAVFGKPITMNGSLMFYKTLLPSGIIASITWKRFESIRSFSLPVRLLEGLKGSQCRERIKLLGKMRYASISGQLTFIYFCFEILLTLLPLFFLYLILEHNILQNIFQFGSFIDYLKEYFTRGTFLAWLPCLFYYLAYSIIAPLYVASGFTLYLNRRLWLESWDIEIVFRKLRGRFEKEQKKPRKGEFYVATITLVLMFSLPIVSQAHQDPILQEKKIRADIKEILANKEFGEEKEITIYDIDFDNIDSKPASTENLPWFHLLLRIIIWLSIFVLLLLAMYFIINKMRKKESWVSEKIEEDQVKELFGMKIQLDQLPRDIPGVAWDYWQQGKYIDSVSLLYRGALSIMVNIYQLPLDTSFTEGDCLYIAEKNFTPEKSDFFKQIVLAWQIIAYGHRRPEEKIISQLCKGWAKYFYRKEGNE